MNADAPLNDHEEHVAIEELYEALSIYGRGTPRLLRMLLAAIRETLVVYQQQEIERVALLERMFGPRLLERPE